MSRILPDWIDTFVEHSKSRGSPVLFRRWAAISAVAAALERKVWLQSNFPTTYPNLFVIMVGSAGSGKSVASNQAMEYPEAIVTKDGERVHFAPNNVSRASVMDALGRATRKILRPGEVPNFVQYNAMTVHARELQVLLPGWDGEIMAHLTDIWDGKTYREEKRGGDLKLEIEAPWLNLLADCPPSYLSDNFPMSAWESGFISRTILVYTAQEAEIPLTFGTVLRAHDATHRELLADMHDIFGMYGEMNMEHEAGAAMVAWNAAKCPPRVTHPRLQNYNARRLAHLMKLCIVASASRGSDRVITLEDYQRAQGWLFEVEANMPGIFVAMQSGGDAIAMRDTVDFVMREGQRVGGPVRHPAVMTFLSTRVYGNDVHRVLAVMLEAEMLRPAMDSQGMKAYTAGPAVFH